ncbi:MAG: polyprenyl diphosphate synthase [Candidatus Paceibacterota bacterium]|jgi:undecaprenyl diphosphate synthase
METTIPNHIAIIPDGNRRWAISKGKKAFLGHKEGANTTEKILKASFDSGVRFFTIWGASEDNLTKRDAGEIKVLSQVFIQTLIKLSKSKELKKYNVRVCVRGRFRELLKSAQLNEIAKILENSTKHNTERVLTVLLGYDGKNEMKEVIKSFKKNGKEVTDSTVHEALFTNNLPPVDLVIRTGGDPHWSAGFMMWLTANSEFFFTDTLWPEFSDGELKKAFGEFSRRRRMMGH